MNKAKKIFAGMLAGVMALSFAACSGGKAADKTDTTAAPAQKTDITVCLDWTPNTNHTGIYVAQSKGFFADEGLDVEIVQPADGTAEGAIGIARTANKVRKEPLQVILNGLGKDAAYIISRINGFTYVQTKYDYLSADVKEDHALTVVKEVAYSNGERSKVKCYGADDVREGVAIMWHEGVGVSITGNSTNPTRFQHPVAGTYKKECIEQGKKYFSVASGGGTGRTLHPDNMAAGPASYGMTDTMGRMHSDAQFAGSSSVPAHVEMMGLIGMGNNPMVGATVAVAVAVEEAQKNA